MENRAIYIYTQLSYVHSNKLTLVPIMYSRWSTLHVEAATTGEAAAGGTT
jgi:hypothetical protein